jgi:ankyrin repeat protein
MLRIVAALLILLAGSAMAQEAPRAEEIAAYGGLHWAAAHGDVAAIERLCGRGADPNVRDALGRTPLHIAASTGQREAASALVRRGADPRAYDEHHIDALTVAGVRGDREMVALLLWLGGDPRAVTGPDDRTALIAAARAGHVDVVNELLAAGAPVNYVSSLGWTALMEAVIFGEGADRTIATVRALLEAGARARFRDWQGTSVLRVAKLRGDEAVAALLISAGAD